MESEESLSAEASSILNIVGIDGLIGLIRDTSELYDLLHMSEEEEVEFANDHFQGNLDEARQIKVIRTVYVLSKMVDNNYRMFKKLHSRHSDFWKKAEKAALREERRRSKMEQ